MFDERIDFEEDWDLWLKIQERYGEDAFGVSERPGCFIHDRLAERHFGPRRFTVDGVPVREYFQQRYGVESGCEELVSEKTVASNLAVAKKNLEPQDFQSAPGSSPATARIPSGNGLQRLISGWSDSGLCDRLTNMLLAYGIGRKSGREIHWHWPLMPACRCPFHELFECDVIKILESPPETGPQIGGGFMTVAEVLQAAAVQDAEPVLRLGWGYFGHNFDGLNIVFRPSPNIAAMIRKFMNDHWQEQMIGVHVRRTDREPHCPSVAAYVAAVDGALAQSPASSLFLATDDANCLQEFTKRYGSRVVLYPVRTLRRDVDVGIIDAVTTLYLLRHTRGVVGSRISGYSLCAGWDCGFLDVPFSGHTPNHPWEGDKFGFRHFNLNGPDASKQKDPAKATIQTTCG